MALVALETTGPADSRSAEVLELAALLVDPSGSSPRTLRALFRPEHPPARGLSGSEGEWAGEIEEAPRRSAEITRIADALRGRTLIGWEVEEARRFLARDFASGFAKAPAFEIGDLLALTHPDAREGQGPLPVAGGSRRARDRADDVLDILLATAAGAEALDSRSINARSALESQFPDSPWLGLLGT
nr:hypothetical protein [Myxococcota bacterium]